MPSLLTGFLVPTAVCLREDLSAAEDRGHRRAWAQCSLEKLRWRILNSLCNDWMQFSARYEPTKRNPWLGRLSVPSYILLFGISILIVAWAMQFDPELLKTALT